MSDDELLHLNDHVRFMRQQDLSCKRILRHYELASESLIEAFFYPMMANEQVIYLAPSKDNIICYQKPNTDFDPANTKSYTIEVNYNTALPVTRNTKEEYTYETFENWDLPFIEAMEDSPKSTYSFELYLMSYIANSPHNKPKSQSKLWIHDMWADKTVNKQLNKDVPMFWFVMPRFQDWIYGVHDDIRMLYDKKYVKLEKKMAACARLLAYKSRKEQYKILKHYPKLRKFLELIKTRSHIPTAFGVICMAAVNACKYTRIELYKFMRNPDKAPEPLKNMLNYYWSSFLMPYTI